ncbi:glycosyltransferase [Candidatus Dependentiae bacterium]
MHAKKLFCLSILTLLLTPLFSQAMKTDKPNPEPTKPTHTEKHIVVVAASYNNKDWYKKHIDSFASQDYPNKTMIYVDDLSPDKTGDLVEQYIQEKNLEDCIILIKNETRKGALANQYYAIHPCKDDDIIIILDGDDWFADNQVLSYINKVYQDPNIWLTYGQFKHLSNGKRGFCSPMPKRVVKNNDFRKHPHIPSHLRTFYAGLFQKIKIEDLMFEGDFLKMTGDIAAMFPMIEMASKGHFKFIPKILLIYNDLNSLNDHKVSKGLQRRLDLLIRSRPKYKPIESPFTNQ